MSQKTKIKSYILIFCCIAFFIAVLDYYVKCFIEGFPIWSDISSFWFVKITHLRNYGGAFSILQNATVLLAAFGIIVPAVVILFFRKAMLDDFRYLLSCACVCGGAWGNLADRLLYGYVVDYISVGTFPVFNISDSFITCGAVALGILILLEKPDSDKFDAAKKNVSEKVSDNDEGKKV